VVVANLFPVAGSPTVLASRCGAAAAAAVRAAIGGAGWRSGDLARRSGERLLGEEDQRETAESDSDTAETDAEFLASQRISACVDIAVAVS
jgi:hypothetical protein